ASPASNVRRPTRRRPRCGCSPAACASPSARCSRRRHMPPTIAAAAKPRTRRRAKDRDLYEYPTGSGIWWVRVSVNGARRKWRVGPREAARAFREKVRGEIAEGRFFPDRHRRKRAVPLLADWITSSLARTASTRRDAVGAARYAYLW